MTFKGTYSHTYTLDREVKKIVVAVKLHQCEGMVEPGQNVYYATATIDGKEINHSGLSHCVDAKLMAERIGKETLLAYKIKAKLDKKTFRMKNK